MKKYLLLCLMFLIIPLLIIPVQVKAVETSATSAILMDIDSGRILYSKDIHNPRSVASISKIMTAIIAIESGKLNDTVTVGAEIEEAYGSGIYIKQGEHITLEALLYGLMLRSGNDGALAIAKYVGGDVDKFVEMMNKKAGDLRMTNSLFNNPSGLDQEKGNYSTAYDMALLTSYAMKNETYKKIVSTKNYKLKTDMNYYDWTNKNKVLFSYKYCTGGKTGFTEIAKRTLVTTASKDNLNLVVVTLNDGNDFFDHASLFNYGFSEYTNYELLKKGLIVVPGENYYERNQLYINNDFYYPFNETEKTSVTLKYELTKQRNYNDGDEVGKVKVIIGDKELKSEPIYISKQTTTVKRNWFGKLVQWFKNVW